MRKKQFIAMNRCAICGELYVPSASSIYKVQFAGRQFPCCSYSCYRTACTTKDCNKQQESQYTKLCRNLLPSPFKPIANLKYQDR